MPSSKSKTWYVSKLVSKSFSVCSPIYSDAQGSKPIKCASVYGYGRPWRESRKRRPRDIGPARCIFNTLSSQSSGLGAEPDPHPQHCVLPNMASLATSCFRADNISEFGAVLARSSKALSCPCTEQSQTPTRKP